MKLSVHNIKDINYVKVRFLMFTADLDYNRFMKTLRRLGAESDLKKQMHLYHSLNPLFKDIAKQTVIEVKDLCKTYYMSGGMSQSVLKHISFKIEAGEFVAIMGHSGSGKSTLMNILGCLDRPTSGKYYLQGDLVSLKTDNELAIVRGEKIGFVFQNFNLLMKRSIADNVSMPLIYRGVGEKERYKKAVEMLSVVGLKGYEDRLPTQISGGMQQTCCHCKSIGK